MNKHSKKSLVLLLDSKLQAAFVFPQESGDLIMGGVRLIDQGFGGWMGFHDWLRKRSLPKQVLGVRFWPNEMSYLPIEDLKDREYISVPLNKKGIEIWFGAMRNLDEGMSGDQAFSLNRVLISENKAHVALVLDMWDLSPEELESVQDTLDAKAAAWTR